MMLKLARKKFLRMAETGAPSPVVMVVEDFEDTRLLMRRFLEMSGCRVVEATDGAKP